MKKLILILAISLALFSCKSKQLITQVPIHTETRVTERLVEIKLPADSAWLLALLECDSANQVILKGLSESKSPNVHSDLKFSNGVLDYRSKTSPPAQQVAVTDSVIYREIPFMVEIPKIEYRQTRWQTFTSILGTLSLIFLILFLGWKILKKTLIK